MTTYKVVITTQEPYEYVYGEKTETRFRDVTLYEQTFLKLPIPETVIFLNNQTLKDTPS